MFIDDGDGDVRTGPITSPKLSPENQAFVGTVEFQEWFGDSVMRSEAGEPLLFYHGTNRQFKHFTHPSQLPGLGNHDLAHDRAGIYFFDSEFQVRQYADPLGAAFNEHFNMLSRVSGQDSWQGAINFWTRFVRSAADDDGRVTIAHELDSHRYNPRQLQEALAVGALNYVSYLMYDGKVMGQLGEYLQVLGGALPGADDELVPYHSMYGNVQQQMLRHNLAGEHILIPKRALGRIIPLFIKATNPHVTTIDNDCGRGEFDSACHQGVAAHNEDPNFDAVIVDFWIDYEPVKGGLVFDPNQLIIAPEP